MEAFADCPLRLTHRIAEVVGRDRFEDHVRRIRLIFACGCGEFVEALSTLEDLEDSETVQSPAFLDGEL